MDMSSNEGKAQQEAADRRRRGHPAAWAPIPRTPPPPPTPSPFRHFPLCKLDRVTIKGRRAPFVTLPRSPKFRHGENYEESFLANSDGRLTRRSR